MHPPRFLSLSATLPDRRTVRSGASQPNSRTSSTLIVKKLVEALEKAKRRPERGAIGYDGVSKLVNEQGGSIGFVEFIYALQNHLSYGRVRNRNSEFVPASLESIAAAASHSMKISRDFNVSIVDAPGAGVYPISSLTWIVVPARSADDG
jgi:ABC-type phosphate transport system substrate-binding protein